MLPVAIALLAVIAVSLAGLLSTDPITYFSKAIRLGSGLFMLLSAAVLVYTFLNCALLDYFQPFSLYDDVIYVTLAGFLLLIIRFIMDAWGYFNGSALGINPILVGCGALLFLASFWGWNLLQGDFDYENIVGNPEHLFLGGEGGYATYRIPGLIVIPTGAQLADGSALEDDLVLAFAEGRRDGSLDDGDIDLVMKRSLDGGQTWLEMVVVRQWEEGVGKIGNPTPVFDHQTGTLHLFHIAGNKPYETWIMRSSDSGGTFDPPQKYSAGIVGPGHGIQVAAGEDAGRLLIPAHSKGSSEALYNDDHGETWMQSAPVGLGNESEIAETWDERQIKVVRTNHPVSQPHEELHTLFSFSDDGGLTWSTAKENPDLRTPICMASIIQGANPDLLYSYPDDYYSRAQMSVARSTDNGLTFPHKTLVYAGPAGYSDLGLLSNGEILLLFENGAVEYDQCITLVRVQP